MTQGLERRISCSGPSNRSFRFKRWTLNRGFTQNACERATSMRVWWIPLGTVTCLLLLTSLLLLARDGGFRNDAAFWSLNVLIIGSLGYQIVSAKSRPKGAGVVLAQILAYPFVLRIAYTPLVGLFGLDPFYELAVAEEIALNGWSLSSSIPAYLVHQYPYPLVHTMGLELATIMGTDLTFQAGWISNLWTLATVLWVYAIATRIYGSSRVGLLAAFGFATLHSFVIYHSLFHRETYAIISLGGAIFTMAAFVKSRDPRFVGLMILFMTATVLGHNLASFILLLFLVFLLSASLLLAVWRRPGRMQRSVDSGPRSEVRLRRVHYMNATFLAATMLFGYWVYLERTPIRILLITLQGLFEPGYSTSFVTGLPDTARYAVLTLGVLILGLAFGIAALVTLLSRGRRGSDLEHGLFLWGGFSGILALATFSSFTQINILPDKLEYYGYFALFILAAGALTTRRSNRRRVIALVVILFLASATFSLYRMPPYLYSAAGADPGSEDIRAYTLAEEYAGLYWLPAGTTVVTGAWMGRVLPPLRGGEVGVDLSETLEPGSIQPGALLFRSSERPRLALAGVWENASAPHVNRLYDNGIVTVLLLGAGS